MSVEYTDIPFDVPTGTTPGQVKRLEDALKFGAVVLQSEEGYVVRVLSTSSFIISILKGVITHHGFSVEEKVSKQ